MAAGVISLLGLVGTATASVVAGWLLPAFIALSVLLLGRSFYILYVQKRGTRFSTAVTWLSAAFVVGYWTWRLTSVATPCPDY
jgi:hypothetical protein